MTERAIRFGCEGEILFGIVHAPQAPSELGVVVVVGGPQYRAGSHRHFVLLARALAASGFAVLRFDVRGMGDSSGRQRNFEAISADIGAAIDALEVQVPQVRRVVLWGLCDGASAALLYLHDTADRRVHGLILLNPWVRTEAGLARTHVKHYYTQRIRQREFWAKLLCGHVGGKAWTGLLASVRAQRGSVHDLGEGTFQTRMAKAWAAFDKNILLILSGDDYTAREFAEFTSASPVWRGKLDRATLQRVDLPGADHTLSGTRDQASLGQAMINWLGNRLACG